MPSRNASLPNSQTVRCWHKQLESYGAILVEKVSLATPPRAGPVFAGLPSNRCAVHPFYGAFRRRLDPCLYPPGRGGGIFSCRRPGQLKILGIDRKGRPGSPRGPGSATDLSRYLTFRPQGLLFLDLPRRHAVGALWDSWAETFRMHLPHLKVARYSAAAWQVCSALLLRPTDSARHAAQGRRSSPSQSLLGYQRCQDAVFLHRRFANRGSRPSRPGNTFCHFQTFLVPLRLSLESTDRTDPPFEPFEDSTGRGELQRMWSVRSQLSLAALCRCLLVDRFSRMYRLLDLH